MSPGSFRHFLWFYRLKSTSDKLYINQITANQKVFAPQVLTPFLLAFRQQKNDLCLSFKSV